MTDTTDAALDALVEMLTQVDKTRHGYSGHPRYNRDGLQAVSVITALRAERDAALARESAAYARGVGDAASVADYAGAIQDQRDGSYAGSVAVMGRDVGDMIRALAEAPPAPVVKVKPLVIGEAALENLLDRRGLREPLEDIKYGDSDIWREICDDTGRAAIAALLPQAGGGTHD